MAETGIFITVEGGDGAGKTTHISFISEYMSAMGWQVVNTREPGGTELGESLRALLLDSNDIAISDHTELLLMFAARMQHIDQVIGPALAQGKCVLCDRFTDATYAYQGAGRGIDDHRISELEQWVQQGLQPDLTIVLDVPVEIGLSRTEQRGQSKDRFEQQQLEFKQAVRDRYLERAEQFPQRIKLIDASKTLDQVSTQIKSCLVERFGA